MVATQPIPRNTPSTSDDEAQALLAVHTKGTNGRVRTRPQAQRGTVPGENPGTKVRS